MSDEPDVRREIEDRIARSERGKLTLKIRTLMEQFGFTAAQRVRQSSLDQVLATLREWGIDHRLPGGMTAYDYITLALAERTATSKKSAGATRPEEPAVDGNRAKLDSSGTDLPGDPLAFSFDVEDALGRDRSIGLVNDLTAAVWMCSPVCAFVDASDEYFLLVTGHLSAIMRRRHLMLRTDRAGDLPIAPAILRSDDLKRVTGQGSDALGAAAAFPASGGVYLVRQRSDDPQVDEMVSFVREAFVPHTYRLRARFGTTAGETDGAQRSARQDPGFSGVLRWMATLAGSPRLPVQVEEGALFDMAGLFTEACRLRDAGLARLTLSTTDPALRAGYESTEHIVLKDVALAHLRERYPKETPLVEEFIGKNGTDADEGDETAQRRNKPDIRIGDRVWVEVETLRGSTSPGSSPFFELERKLRQKLGGMRSAAEVWLIVPGDIILLASAQMSAVVRNLAAAATPAKFRLGFGDLVHRELAFVKPTPAPRPEVPQLSGASSWRETKRVEADAPLTWRDVAGYSSLKEQVDEQVLAPLRDPQRYLRHGLGCANGLLLFGLPGCGKSLIGRVLAGEADITCRRLGPSDFTSKWLGEGVEMIEEVFDWAIKQSPCLLVIDEIDAIAPQRREQDMHSDEKRQVNELLAQLDRIAGKPIVVVGTTNYVTGIDTAIRRSGRFDAKLAVLPPTEDDRAAIFRYYLRVERLKDVEGLADVDHGLLAKKSPLFTPADIKSVVDALLRRAISKASNGSAPKLTTESLLAAIDRHARSIQREQALEWIEHARDLEVQAENLRWLEEEVLRAFPTS